LIVELPQQLADRGIEFSQTVEAAVAQAAKQPSLDDQHRDFDFRLVARPARPGWQDRGIVVGRHLGVGSIDLRLVETGLDDGHLGVIRHQHRRRQAREIVATAAARRGQLRPA
jgi:hypothetical protein